MNNLDSLIKYFETFPGIGGRQARRFAFHVLTMQKEDVSKLSSLISSIQETVTECVHCHRFYSKNGGNSPLCFVCADTSRDNTKLMVVERDSDIQSVERSGVYDGLYFVLGGTVPLLHSEDTKKLRGGGLKRTVGERLKEGLSEIILAFAVNPDGENTSRFVESIVKELLSDTEVTVSQLGRGLSTGSELEYADPETLKNALQNRH